MKVSARTTRYRAPRRHDGHGRHDGDELHQHDPGLHRGAHPRSTHTLIALLVDNEHVPLMPLIAAWVTVRIGK